MYKDFPSIYQSYIFISRYARYIESEHRRESWPETVKRYFDFFEGWLKENKNFDLKPYRKELEEGVLTLKVMPSMRGLMTAGPALKRDEGAIYNCAFLPIDNLRSFDEILYTLMLGSGVGFSVEHINTSQLPSIPDEFVNSEITVVFEDSRLGWARGYREYLSLLINGQIPKYDLSKLRKKGARLKTFGGRSSGPEPLRDLLDYTRNKMIAAAGRKLTTLECHDIACKIADIVVVGGVRRSAMISLSDLQDDRLRDAKSGAWYNTNAHRRLANNTAVYEEKPDIGVFMREWSALYESKSGERGIFSRKAAKKVVDNANSFRSKLLGSTARLREWDPRMGMNPCAEILLKPYEFCNLTSAQIREYDDVESLKKKIRLATILGTIQSCLTNFKHINKKWQRNCEDERLLGVSLNGIFDNELTSGKLGKDVLAKALTDLKTVALNTNVEWAAMLGINASVAVSAIKPEGTSSALNGTSSGIHPAHAPFYIRYVRNDKKDPLTDFMIAAGIPYEVDHYDPLNMIAFKFPLKSAEGAVCRKDLSAIEHLEIWKIYQEFYCEHKPSITVSIKESEWLKVGAWVYDNFEWMSGVAFLPEEDHIYTQAPFTDCSKEDYEALLAVMPTEVDWSKLSDYEKEDTTTNAQTLACSGSTEGCFI